MEATHLSTNHLAVAPKEEDAVLPFFQGPSCILRQPPLRRVSWKLSFYYGMGLEHLA